MDKTVELLRFVAKTLSTYTRLQSLCIGILGLERMWQIFLDWTKIESVPYLLRSPEQYREPFRHAIDLLWEQVKNEQIYNEHKTVFDDLYHFEQSSYDEEDALDIDYGNVRQFIAALTSSGIGAFFPIKPERQNEFPWNSPDYYEKQVASLATVYASTLYDFLYNSYAEKAPKAERGISPSINTMVADDPLWKEEVDRIHSDLLLVRDYPSNKEIVFQRAAAYRKLRTKPFCS